MAMHLERPDYGPWRYCRATDTLDAGALNYYLHNDTAKLVDMTPTEKWDWVAHVAAKTWATADVVAGLVRALDDLDELTRRR